MRPSSSSRHLQYDLFGTSNGIIFLKLVCAFTRECSIHFRYSVWGLFLFKMNLKTQSIKISERGFIWLTSGLSVPMKSRILFPTFILIRFFGFWHGVRMPIHTIMSIVFVLCTLSTEDSFPLKGCKAAKSSVFSLCHEGKQKQIAWYFRFQRGLVYISALEHS